MVYLRHAIYQDGIELKRYFEKADIIAPEDSTSNHIRVTEFQKVATEGRGQSALRSIPLTQRFFIKQYNPFYEGLLDALAKSKKRVISIDLLAGTKTQHEFQTGFDRELSNAFFLPKVIGTKNYDEACAFMLASFQRYAALQRKREQYMRGRLGPELVMALRHATDLHEPKRIRPIEVCIPIGAMHYPMGKALAKGGDMVREVDISPPSDPTDLHDSLSYKVNDGVQPTTRELELAMASNLVEYILYANAFMQCDPLLQSALIRSPKMIRYYLAQAIGPEAKAVYQQLRLVVDSHGRTTPAFKKFIEHFMERYYPRALELSQISQARSIIYRLAEREM
jgi:hypothetical protein